MDIILVLLLIFLSFGLFIFYTKKVEDKKYASELKHLEELKEEKRAVIKIKEQKYQSLLQVLPNADLTIEYDLDKFVLLKEESSQILLNEHLYTFKDILDFTVSDNQTVIHRGGDSTATTTTSTGSMLGRAVVGGVLTGGIGALVGAATARKETEIHQNDTYSSTKHNYTINVTINSLSLPVETLALFSNEEATNKVISILTIILHRNKQDK